MTTVPYVPELRSLRDVPQHQLCIRRAFDQRHKRIAILFMIALTGMFAVAVPPPPHARSPFDPQGMLVERGHLQQTLSVHGS